MAYSDGTFTSVKQNGPTRLSYPFLNSPTKDSTTKMYETDYAVLPGSWTPAAALMTYPGDGTFAADANAYLVEETPPQDAGGFYKLTRRWSKVPGNQVTPGSRLFVRPPLHDIFSGSAYGVSFDKGNTTHIFLARAAVTAVGTPDVPNTANPENGSTPGILPHVLITVTANNSTQTFYADDTDVTIQNAISTAVTGGTGAAANFKILRNIGSLTVTVVTTNTTISALSSPAASVKVTCPYGMALATGAGPGTIVSLEAATTNAASVRRLTTAIAAAVGQWMAVWNGDKLAGTGKVVATDGSTYSDLELSEIPGKDFKATHAAVAGVTAGLRVVNGYRECSMRTTQKFYLPTVTPGITVAADIPGTAIYADAVAWLGRIVATTLTSATATAATDRITKTAHGMAQGETFFLSAIGSGAAGLAVSTQYWAIYVDADNIKAATSQENALAGTAIDITSDGTGLTLIVPDPWPEIALSDLKQWEGPILTKSIDEVQMADALESRSAAA